jgi:hypothetical protein
MQHGGGDQTISTPSDWTLLEEDEGGSAHMPIATAYRTDGGTLSAAWTLGGGANRVTYGIAEFVASAGGAATSLIFTPGPRGFGGLIVR